MKAIELIYRNHDIKIGDICLALDPNIKEDCLFFLNGLAVGFYITNLNDRLKKLIEIANNEFISDNVPKSKMNRGTQKQAEEKGIKWITQYSTIIGNIPPKPHFKRNYGSKSSVHGVVSARNFIKSMLLISEESEKIIKEIMPKQYEKQIEIFKSVKEEWKFGNIFTSSISNFNISAPYHLDTGNFKDTVNVIFTKRKMADGGYLNVPDYGITIEQADNSMLVYPAWANVHGVTPINKKHVNGYRNSLIFYPLKAFGGL